MTLNKFIFLRFVFLKIKWSIHNTEKQIVRDRKTGRIIGVIKFRELLENLEADNQQPSLDSNIFEGSTTSNQIQTDNAEDSIVTMSAEQLEKVDDIV